jgi:hypothetical protein
MKLSWQEPESVTDKRMYPQGYWYAFTDDGNYDATGGDPLAAIAALAAELEKALREKT